MFLYIHIQLSSPARPGSAVGELNSPCPAGARRGRTQLALSRRAHCSHTPGCTVTELNATAEYAVTRRGNLGRPWLNGVDRGSPGNTCSPSHYGPPRRRVTAS